MFDFLPTWDEFVHVMLVIAVAMTYLQLIKGRLIPRTIPGFREHNPPFS